MLGQVLENLVTLISCCESACGQAVGPNPVATVRQKTVDSASTHIQEMPAVGQVRALL